MTNLQAGFCSFRDKRRETCEFSTIEWSPALVMLHQTARRECALSLPSARQCSARTPPRTPREFGQRPRRESAPAGLLRSFPFKKATFTDTGEASQAKLPLFWQSLLQLRSFPLSESARDKSALNSKQDADSVPGRASIHSISFEGEKQALEDES